MKTVSQQEAVIPYKVIRKPSPLPFIVAGLAFLLYGLLRPIATLPSYILGALIAGFVYVVGKGIWPDQKIKEELKPDTGDINTDQLLGEARTSLVAIRAANDRIADPKVSATIDSIESTCLKILSRLEEDVSLYSQLRTFLRYYLPTTRKLLDARAAIENDSSSQNAVQVRDRTDRVLTEIEKAFQKQLEALDKHKYLDIQVEMDVLEGMLKSDGLDQGTETAQHTLGQS